MSSNEQSSFSLDAIDAVARSTRLIEGGVRARLSADAVAAAGLGFVETFVGALDDGGGIAQLRIDGGDAHRDGERDARVFELEVGLLHYFADLLGERQAVSVVDLREHDGELLTAVAGETIFAANLGADRL